MKCKIYQQLTAEQREEWKFKYEHKFNIPNGLIYAIGLYLTMGHFMMVSLILLKDYVPYQGSVLNILLVATNIPLIFLVAYLTEILYEFGIFVWKNKKEKKWLKEIGVKK